MHPSEENYLRHFNNNFDYPFEVVEITKSERPDFLIHTNEYTVGLELTELFKKFQPDKEPNPHQALESEWAKIGKKAHEKWDKLHILIIDIDTDFNKRYFINHVSFSAVETSSTKNFR